MLRLFKYIFAPLLFISSTNAFAQDRIYFLHKITEEPIGSYALRIQDSVTGAMTRMELSAEWLSNNEAGLSKLKLVQELAGDRVVPISLSYKRFENRAVIFEIQIRPEPTTVDPNNGIFRITIDETGSSRTWLDAAGNKISANKFDADIAELKRNLPSKFAGETVYFFQKIVRSPEGVYFIDVKEGAFAEATTRLELSAQWLGNDEAGLSQLKLIRDLAKERLVPITVSEKLFGNQLGNRRVVSEIQIRPENTIVEPDNKIFRFVLDESGYNYSWKDDQGTQVRKNKIYDDLGTLKRTLPSNTLEGETYFFSKVVKNSAGDYYVKLKLRPGLPDVLTIKLNDTWAGGTRNGLILMRALTGFAETTAIPVQLTTLPNGTGRDVISLKIVPEEVMNNKAYLIIGAEKQIAYSAPLAKGGREIDFMNVFEQLKTKLPSNCTIINQPQDALNRAFKFFRDLL